GLYASPGSLPGAVLPALVAGAVVVLAARPLSVLVSATPLRVPWREQAFIAWSGLRGAVPIVLALVPLTVGVPGARLLVDAVFVLVIVLTLLQGTTLPLAARRLGVLAPAEASEMEVDSATLDELNADLLQVRVPVGSRLHGVYLAELRLPVGATVSLLVRNGTGFTPQPTTRVQEGDQLLVVSTVAARAAAEQRLRAVHRAGRLARWLGEAGRS
ncbi:MAG TPA: cation:proton antiporter, partial [Pseudonocardiaceae bacterium]